MTVAEGMLHLLFLFAVVGTGVAAGLLTVLGWRGRVVDDHPHCRRCGFDLFGSPGAASCPECGRKLSGRRAIRQGTRVRRRAVLVMGLVCVLLCVGSSFLVLEQVYRNHWQEAKPTWLLLLEAEYSHATAADSALSELTRRYISATGAARDMTPGQVTRLVDVLLRQQADRASYWDTDFAKVLETEVLATVGSVDQARLRRFLEQAITVKLTLPPKVKTGEPIPYEAKLDVRSWYFNPFWLDRGPRFNTVGTTVEIDGVKDRQSASGELAWIPDAGSFSMERSVRPGRHEVVVHYDIEFWLDPNGPTPLHTFTLTARAEVEFVAGEVAPVELQRDADAID